MPKLVAQEQTRDCSATSSLTESLPNDRTIDIPETAYFLKVSYWTVRRLILDGRLPASKVGQSWRINPQDVLALLAGDER